MAYALAGTTDINLAKEPLGTDADGKPVMMSEIWPSAAEIAKVVDTIGSDMFQRSYGNVFDGNETWNAISGAGGELFEFTEASSYIQEPPFFVDLTPEPAPLADVRGARVLVLLGDSVTTDHISPAGDIPADGPAGTYLKTFGLEKKDFNSFGSRRGNDRVMTRGTFANIRIKNLMVPGTEGGYTVHVPSGDQSSIFEAAERYKAEGTPLIVLAGKEYGTGSSRDWAAKGTLLLGVKAVIAQSFERIHRSNLVGMGVLPLQFDEGQSAESPRLDGSGEVRRERHLRRLEATRTAERHGREARRIEGHLPGNRAARYPGGRDVLPQRGHPAHGAAEDAQRLVNLRNRSFFK